MDSKLDIIIYGEKRERGIFVIKKRIYFSAVIDLNGRFFGGRQVKAGFYNNEDFKMYKLNEPVQF